MYAVRRILVAMTIAVALITAMRSADAFEFSDIEGKWCGDTSIYTFTRRQLIVTFYDRTPTRRYEITNYEYGDDMIKVLWLRDGEELYTLFGNFRGERMTQLPQTTGDKGPRREFRRC
jgi:hypothetical protein